MCSSVIYSMTLELEANISNVCNGLYVFTLQVLTWKKKMYCYDYKKFLDNCVCLLVFFFQMYMFTGVWRCLLPLMLLSLDMQYASSTLKLFEETFFTSSVRQSDNIFPISFSQIACMRKSESQNRKVLTVKVLKILF